MILVRDIKEIAEHATSGRAPALCFDPVAPASQSAVRPPLFLLGPANGGMLAEIFAQTDTPPVGCYSINSATLAPTGIAIKDGVAFYSDALIHPRHHVVAISDRLNASGLPFRHVPGKLAVIYGPANETWGHWLTDFLPRLWVLHAAGYDLAALAFVMPPDLQPFARRLLRQFGLRENQLITYRYWQEILTTDTLLIPTGLRAQNRLAPCFAQATEFWISRSGFDQQPAPYPQAVFLSRGAAPPDRALQNRDEIEAVARAAGLVIIQPEALSLPAQAALFAGARLIVGEYGSALHNSVFSGAGAVVCGLRGNARHPSFIQNGIATSLGQETAYVFGAASGEGAAQRFSIDPVLFRRGLDLLRLHVAW